MSGVSEAIGAGWSSPVARQAHNLKVVGSNPTPATSFTRTRSSDESPAAFFAFLAWAWDVGLITSFRDGP